MSFNSPHCRNRECYCDWKHGCAFRIPDPEIARLTAALDYVYERTYCGTDAEWHFKPGYDPQVVIDALKGD